MCIQETDYSLILMKLGSFNAFLHEINKFNRIPYLNSQL